MNTAVVMDMIRQDQLKRLQGHHDKDSMDYATRYLSVPVSRASPRTQGKGRVRTGGA